MRIIDEQGHEVDTYDPEVYHLAEDVLVTHHPSIPEVPEKSHIETVWQNPEDPDNRLTKRVIDQVRVPERPAWDETEKVQRLVAYTPEEILARAEERERREQEEREAAKRAEAEAAEKATKEALMDSLPEAVAETAGIAADTAKRMDDIEAAVAELGVLLTGNEEVA